MFLLEFGSCAEPLFRVYILTPFKCTLRLHHHSGAPQKCSERRVESSAGSFHKAAAVSVPVAVPQSHSQRNRDTEGPSARLPGLWHDFAKIAAGTSLMVDLELGSICRAIIGYVVKSPQTLNSWCTQIREVFTKAWLWTQEIYSKATELTLIPAQILAVTINV